MIRATGTLVSSDDESGRERRETCSRATTSHLASDRNLALERRRVISRMTGTWLSSDNDSCRERRETCSLATTSHLASGTCLALERRRVMSRETGALLSSDDESCRELWETCAQAAANRGGPRHPKGSRNEDDSPCPRPVGLH